MNSPYASPQAQLGGARKWFSARRALLAYVIAILTLVGLIVGLGFALTGQLPTADGYSLLWPVALISCLAVGVIGGHIGKTSWSRAAAVGVVGGVALLGLIVAAAFVLGRAVRAI